MSLRIAQVVAVHPERRTVDLVFQDDGWRTGDVPVASSAASSDAGAWFVPDVPRPASEQEAGGFAREGRTMLAVCGFVAGRPIVLAFIHPVGGQVAFKQQDRTVFRHPSGTYVTVAPDGSIEARHPGGAYLRIGVGETEDLAPLAAEENWQMPEAEPPQVTLVTDGFKLVIRPGGDTELSSDGKLDATVKGPVTVSTDAALTLNYESATLNGDVTLNGDLKVDGKVGASGDVNAAGDIKAGSTSLKTHKHLGVRAGTDITGGPT